MAVKIAGVKKAFCDEGTHRMGTKEFMEGWKQLSDADKADLRALTEKEYPHLVE